MKKNIIIANWKMNLGLSQTISLTKDILSGLKKNKKDWAKIDIILCPSYVYLSEVKNLINKSDIALGAQDCFWEERGAYTGEVSPAQLKEMDCQYVIIGHSERRQYLNETDEMIHKKIKTALEVGLIPILCVGETFEERQKGIKDYVIINQVNRALEGINLKANQQLIIAYEPVWVIGSGQAVKPEEAEYANRIILQQVIDLYPLPIIRSNIRTIYGGSVDHTNVKDFVQQDTIDGVLVGGASLRAEEFVKMINQLIS